MLAGLRTARGIARSLKLYYGDRPRRDAMQRLYGSFVGAGDLVFDVGAHVGDRTAAFRRLGARVVAVEPQPALARTLALLYRRFPEVTVEPAAVGRAPGTVTMQLNPDNPTVATASRAFIDAARGAAGWETQEWSTSVDVPMTTLDALIARHGLPRFIKIDVEGYEGEALLGLTQPVPALSFEFTTIQREVAFGCLGRCAALDYRAFNASIGENQRFEHDTWLGVAEIARWLEALPHAANSGDIYATLG
jgi:FkbM family methyltransferase